MSSPGGVEVARVSVRVVPDTSKFRREAQAELKKVTKGLKVVVDVVLDTTGVKAELEKIKKSADGKKAQLDVTANGDGVPREVRRIKQIAQKLVGAIKLTVGVNMAASIVKIKAEMEVLQKIVKGYDFKVPIDLVSWGKLLLIAGAISATLLTMPHLVGAIGGAVVVLGGLLATIPALIAGVAASIAVLAVGMNGFFSALSQSGDAAAFEEALKKLTPAAQESARALATFREPLREIKESVQESLFKGMADDFLKLKALLPPIKTGLTGIAGGMREMFRSWIQMASSNQSVEDTGTILDNIKKGFEQAKPAAADFGQAMRDITVVGSTFLPAIGKSVADVTKKFADWAASARESGRLEEIIQNAFDKVKQFGRVIADVTVGIRNMFKSLSTGQDFLDVVESLTQAFRDWTELDATKKTLESIGNFLRVVATAAGEVVKAITEHLGPAFTAMQPFLETFVRAIGSVLVDALTVLGNVLSSVGGWLSRNREVMVPLVITLISLVTAFKLAATAAKGIVAISDSVKAMKAASSIIGTVVESIAGIGSAMWKAAGRAWAAAGRTIAAWTEMAAEAAYSSALTAKAWIQDTAKAVAEVTKKWAKAAKEAIVNWVKMAAAATANAAKAAAAWIAQTARAAAIFIAQVVTAAAVWVANWVRMAAVALANAARMALAWLIALGPIAIIAAAVIALAVLIITNWDSIVAFLKGVWEAIKTAAEHTWNAIRDFFLMLWEPVKTAWDAVWKFVSDIITGAGVVIGNVVDAIKGFLNGILDVVNNVKQWFIDMGNGMIAGIQTALNWLSGIKDAILGFFKDAGNWLKDVGKNIVGGLKKGWDEAWSTFKSHAIDQGQSFVDEFKGFWGIKSPSRLMMGLGRYITQGLAIGVESQSAKVLAAGNQISEAVLNGFGTPKLELDLVSAIEAQEPKAAAAMQSLSEGLTATADTEWKASIEAGDFSSVGEQVARALEKVEIKMDSKPVGKILSKNANANLRRG